MVNFRYNGGIMYDSNKDIKIMLNKQTVEETKDKVDQFTEENWERVDTDARGVLM
jgi:hypothetical protein